MFRQAKYFSEVYRRRLIQAAAVGSIMAGYYVYHLEPTPVTGVWDALILGRRKFVAITREQEKRLSKLTFDSVMNQYHDRVIPSWNPVGSPYHCF